MRNILKNYGRGTKSQSQPLEEKASAEEHMKDGLNNIRDGRFDKYATTLD